MSREIKFRVWDEAERIMMSWEEIDESDKFGIYQFLDMIEEDGFEVMQYIGLKDKNGREIYEGDIGPNNHQVFWKNIGWAIKNDKYEFIGWVPEKFEVIGNIYENPELLP